MTKKLEDICTHFAIMVETQTPVYGNPNAKGTCIGCGTTQPIPQREYQKMYDAKLIISHSPGQMQIYDIYKKMDTTRGI